MSHTHTTVSASVIKSTSRFAPKAIPRKKQAAPPPTKPTPAPPPEESSESEDQLEEEPSVELLEENERPIGTLS